MEGAERWLPSRGQSKLTANGLAPPPFDIYLVGSAYSGSTFLGSLLAESLDATYVGETAHLPQFVARYNLYDQPLGCLRCASEDQECPVWTQEFIQAVELAGPAAAMDVFRRTSGVPVVIDGSKSPAWLRLAMQDRPADAPPVLVVIVARSPLPYAMSAIAATGAPAWLVAEWWRDVYADAFRTVNRLQLPVIVARNEEVRKRPQHLIGTIADLVGQRVVPDRRPTNEHHSLGGNLFVHRGYSEDTSRLYAKLGLFHLSSDSWDAADWERAARVGSVVEMLRSRTDLDTLVQAMLDCPGLIDVASILGYELASEMATLLLPEPSTADEEERQRDHDQATQAGAHTQPGGHG